MKIKPNAADGPRTRRQGGVAKPLTGRRFSAARWSAIANSAATTRPTATRPGVGPDSAVTSLRPLNTDATIPGFKGQPKPLEPLTAAGVAADPEAEDDTGSRGACRGVRRRREHDKLVETARKLGRQTFYGTMLKQMRNSPFKSEMFEGGRGGQAFAPLLDQHLAEHMSRGRRQEAGERDRAEARGGRRRTSNRSRPAQRGRRAQPRT